MPTSTLVMAMMAVSVYMCCSTPNWQGYGEVGRLCSVRRLMESQSRRKNLVYTKATTTTSSGTPTKDAATARVISAGMRWCLSNAYGERRDAGESKVLPDSADRKAFVGRRGCRAKSIWLGVVLLPRQEDTDCRPAAIYTQAPAPFPASTLLVH